MEQAPIYIFFLVCRFEGPGVQCVALRDGPNR